VIPSSATTSAVEERTTETRWDTTTSNHDHWLPAALILIGRLARRNPPGRGVEAPHELR
jgi:hypothetical protein